MVRKLLTTIALLATLGITTQTAEAQYQGTYFYRLYNSLFGKETSEVKKQSKQINPIYSTGDLTVAGNGLFLTSYVNPSQVSENRNYDLTKEFTSKDKLVYHALTSTKLDEIIKNSKVSPEVKRQIRALQRKVKKNKSMDHQRFSRAIKDGNLSENELFMISEGTYAYLVTTGRQGIVGFYEVKKLERKKSLEREVKDAIKEMSSTQKDVLRFEVKTDTVEAEAIKQKRKEKTSRDSSDVDSSSSKYTPKRVETDPSKLFPQYTQPIDMHVHADSTDLTNKDIPRIPKKATKEDSLQTQPSFYVEKKDSLILLKPFKDLKLEEKKAWNSRVVDVVKNKGFRYIRPGVYTSNFKEKKQEREAEFGIRTGAFLSGKKQIGMLGAVGEFPLSENFGLETFADWMFMNGKPYFSEKSQNTTTRATQLIGPATYKTRVDQEEISTGETPFAQIGAGVNYNLSNAFEVGLGVGIKALRELTEKAQTSTISFERNNVLLGLPETIKNNEQSKSVKFRPSGNAKLRLNLWKGGSLDAVLDATVGKKIIKTNGGVVFTQTF